MKILHGTWIPEANKSFIQEGNFYLWVETSADTQKRKPAKNVHPSQLCKPELEAFLSQELGLKSIASHKLSEQISPQYFLLPSAESSPLPSLELSRYLEEEPSETFELAYWQIDSHCVREWVRTDSYQLAPVTNVIKLLNELHFIAVHNLAEVQMGADLLFWYHYTQAFKQIILKDQYIPALKYRDVAAAETATNSKRKTSKSKANVEPSFEIYAGWEILSELYETDLKRYAEYMPLACVSGFAEP
jgi:hypothetical protein